MIRVGKHDQRLTFQALTTATDGMGSVTETWGAGFTVWGKVSVDKSEEDLQASQRTGKQMVIIETRADTKTRTITAKHRMHWDGREWDLSPPRPFPAGRPERIEFTATARSN